MKFVKCFEPKRQVGFNGFRESCYESCYESFDKGGQYGRNDRCVRILLFSESRIGADDADDADFKSSSVRGCVIDCAFF